MNEVVAERLLDDVAQFRRVMGGAGNSPRPAEGFDDAVVVGFFRGNDDGHEQTLFSSTHSKSGRPRRLVRKVADDEVEILKIVALNRIFAVAGRHHS